MLKIKMQLNSVDVAQQTAEYAACIANEACDVATSVSEDEMYGGIQQVYTVEGPGRAFFKVMRLCKN